MQTFFFHLFILLFRLDHIITRVRSEGPKILKACVFNDASPKRFYFSNQSFAIYDLYQIIVQFMRKEIELKKIELRELRENVISLHFPAYKYPSTCPKADAVGCSVMVRSRLTAQRSESTGKIMQKKRSIEFLLIEKKIFEKNKNFQEFRNDSLREERIEGLS